MSQSGNRGKHHSRRKFVRDNHLNPHQGAIPTDAIRANESGFVLRAVTPHRTILITGAAGGIGQALAMQYAQPGRRLLLHGRTETSLLPMSHRCQDQGAETILLAHDLVDHAGWMDKLAAIDADSPVDLAFVNAGVAHVSLGGVESWACSEQMLDVNLRAAMATSTVLARAMRIRRSGHIVFISSLAGGIGMAMTPAYCATKAALTTYGDAMRGRLATAGVRVTVVLPGFVESAMSRRFPAAKPALISAQSAALRIERALRRNPARISFPTPLALGLAGLAALPVDWSHFILTRLGFGLEQGVPPPPGER